jgi:hypothetical protein
MDAALGFLPQAKAIIAAAHPDMCFEAHPSKRWCWGSSLPARILWRGILPRRFAIAIRDCNSRSPNCSATAGTWRHPSRSLIARRRRCEIELS